ncbi:MAG: hypothetical protein JSU88_00625 [Nitrospinaceae bacterium]|jgi:hypothetical protein|nr:MAG: hypothetical protein JSU88_00625 [Nitrospinaceae bacterium]
MDQIKQDLICEIIRMSQINLLEKKRLEINGACDEQSLLDWVKDNAAEYRESFKARLESFTCSQLGDILKRISESGRDLSQILEGDSLAPTPHGASPMNP